MKHPILTVFCLAGCTTLAVAKDDARLELSEATRQRCLEVLRAGFASDEFWPAMHAAEGLTVAGLGDEVRPRLLKFLETDTDSQHRCGLARELVRAGDLTYTSMMLAILQDPDPYGHTHSCESLYKVWQLGDGTAIRHAWKTSESSKTRVMAAAALARWGNREALEAIRADVADADDDRSRTAAWVLARVGDQSDIERLRSRYPGNADALTKAYFDHALATLGDAAGLEALIRNLSHDDGSVRVYAAEFAPDARALAAGPRLEAMLQDPILDVRIRSAQALLMLAAPTIPDAKSRFTRQVFKASNEFPRYSEGSVIVLRDGRLLYATTQFHGSGNDHATARILAVESSDDGRTWSAPRVLQENTGSQNVMSVTLRRLSATGDYAAPLALVYLEKNSATDLHAKLRISNDEGATFGPILDVTSGPGYHVLNNDRITILKSGRLIAPVAISPDVVKHFEFESFCFLSDDNGQTWRPSKNRIAYPKRGAMEPEVLELTDGRLLMHIRTQLGHLAVSESSDGGETWSEARSWDVAGPEAPATLRRIPSTGDLLLIWNDSHRPGNPNPNQRNPLTVAISTDEGKTWTMKRDLAGKTGEAYAYTSVVFDRGRALLTYYVASAGKISSTFDSVPIAWFYEAE